jgi:hypothetical protein
MTFFDIRVRLLLKPRRILVLLKTTNPLVRKRKDKQPRKLQRKLPRKLQKRIQSAMSASSIYRLALSGKHGSTLLLTGAVFLNFIFFWNSQLFFSLQSNFLLQPFGGGDRFGRWQSASSC